MMCRWVKIGVVYCLTKIMFVPVCSYNAYPTNTTQCYILTKRNIAGVTRETGIDSRTTESILCMFVLLYSFLCSADCIFLWTFYCKTSQLFGEYFQLI